FEHIRENGADAETLNVVYVVDSGGRLQDFVRLKKLLLADPAAKCESLCKGRVRSLLATDDQEAAVVMMREYDTPVLPVTDDDGVLVGIVTFDDVADIAEEEVTEDMQKMGGMQELDEPYIEAPLMELVWKRVVWLFILFCGGLVAVSAMGFFDEALAKYTILALFVPLIIASGGNSGSQAASLIIRSLTTAEVDTGDWLLVLRRELASGLLMGGLLGVCGFITGMAACFVPMFADTLASPPTLYGLAIGLSVLAVVMVGTLTGGMLPLLLKKMGFDPAAGSTPLVATIVDAAGLVLYFVVATLVLG
ncbi:MAG: magnesium transporter, partial [Planctomycetota bacterium]